MDGFWKGRQNILLFTRLVNLDVILLCSQTHDSFLIHANFRIVWQKKSKEEETL
jgi:hypothetical protein